MALIVHRHNCTPTKSTADALTDREGLALITIPPQNPGTLFIDAQTGNLVSKHSVTVEYPKRNNTQVNIKPMPQAADLKIKTDKSFYAPGDTVNVSIETEKKFPTINLCASITFRKKIRERKTRQNYDESMWYDVDDIKGGIFKYDIKHVMTKAIFAKSVIKDNNALPVKWQFKIPASIQGINFDCEDTKLTISISAGKELKDIERIVTTRPLRIDAQPEFNQSLPGMSTKLYIFTFDPTGKPVATDFGYNGINLQTGHDGSYHTLLPAWKTEAILTVKVPSRKRFTKKISIPCNKTPGAFLLQTEQVIYHEGQTVNFLITTNTPVGNVYINFVKNDATLAISPIKLRSKKQFFKVKIPKNETGTMGVHVYKLLSNGNVLSNYRVIQIIPGSHTNIPSQGTIQSLLQEKILIQALVQKQSPKLLGKDSLKKLLKSGSLADVPLPENRLSQSTCPKYINRKLAISKANTEYCKLLLKGLCAFSVLLAFIISIPFILFVISLDYKHDFLIVSPIDCKRLKRSFALIFLYIIAGVISFYILYICKFGFDTDIILVKNTVLTLVQWAIMLIIYYIILRQIITLRRRIVKILLSICTNKITMLCIDLIPIFAGLFIVLATISITAWTFNLTEPDIQTSSIVFLLFTLIPLYGIITLRNFCITQDRYETILSAFSLGAGIGNAINPMYRSWLIYCMIFFVSWPIVIVYIIFAITVFAFFIPFTP